MSKFSIFNFQFSNLKVPTTNNLHPTTTKSGFTLIETLVVLVIISAISVIGLMRLRTFQKDAVLDSAANELQTAIRFAQNKSQSGEIPDPYDLSSFEESYEPKYGIRLTASGYEIYSDYRLLGDTSNSTLSISAYDLSDELTLSISGTPLFDRLTGKSGGFDIDITANSGESRKVSFTTDGYITITE